MSERKNNGDNQRLKSIENAAAEIFEKAEAREKAGKDSFEANWQAALETMLLLMKKHLNEGPGQLLPMQIDGQEEWEFYLDIQEKLNLPPHTCAAMITPSAYRSIQIPKDDGSESPVPKAWKRDAYSIIISDLQDHRIIMQVSLPGIETVGIDVFEDGKHFADYAYNTVEECLDDLAKVTWIYFNPEGKWSDELIIRYTENWFAKGLLMDLENVVIHEEHSYLHHPELLNLTPLESVLRAIEATIPKEYDSLEKAIESANDLNRDFNLGDPIITKVGILQDKEPECRVLLGRIEFEIDLHLEKLENLRGVRLPRRSGKDSRYLGALDETASNVYQLITGRPYPE